MRREQSTHPPQQRAVAGRDQRLCLTFFKPLSPVDAEVTSTFFDPLNGHSVQSTKLGTATQDSNDSKDTKRD